MSACVHVSVCVRVCLGERECSCVCLSELRCVCAGTEVSIVMETEDTQHGRFHWLRVTHAHTMRFAHDAAFKTNGECHTQCIFSKQKRGESPLTQRTCSTTSVFA